MQRSQCLLVAQAGHESAIPLLVTHGLQCDWMFAAMLAKVIADDVPIYGLSAPGLDGKEHPLESISGLAERFLEEVDQVTRSGPVRLAGFCAGAHITLEMAHRLVRGGRSVDHVYLIDAPRKMPTADFDRLADQQVMIAAQRLVQHPQLHRHFLGAPLTVRKFTQALKTHTNVPYAGRTSLFVSEEQLSLATDPVLGWPKYLREDTDTLLVAKTRVELLASGMTQIAAALTA